MSNKKQRLCCSFFLGMMFLEGGSMISMAHGMEIVRRVGQLVRPNTSLTPKSFQMRYKVDMYGNYFQPEQHDRYYAQTTHEFSSWGAYCQHIRHNYSLKEACFIKEIDMDKVDRFLEENAGVTYLELVDPLGFDSQKFSLDFLNKYPQIKKLRLYLSNTYDNTHVDLSSLRYIEHFIKSNSNNKQKVIFPVESLISVDTNVDDLPSLSNKRKIKSLKLRSDARTPVSLQCLEPFENLISLDIGGLGTSDMSVIAALQHLANLSLYGLYPDYGNYSFLHKLSKLKTLNVSYDSKFNLKSIEGLLLENLRFGHASGIEDLGIISTLKELKKLELGCAYNLKDLLPLHKNRFLKTLNVSFAKNIDSIESLRDLPLTELELPWASVRDLGGLATLKQLEILNISGNYPIYWNGLQEHSNLKRIQLNKEDLESPHLMDRGIGDISLDQLSDYRKEFLEKAPKYEGWYPLSILKTIPNLELIDIIPQDIPTSIREDFKNSRPNVKLRKYADWKRVDLSKE